MNKDQSEHSRGNTNSEKSLVEFTKHLWRRLRAQFRRQPKESRDRTVAEPSAACGRHDPRSASIPTQVTEQSMAVLEPSSSPPSETATGTSKTRSDNADIDGPRETPTGPSREATFSARSKRHSNPAQPSKYMTRTDRGVRSQQFEYWDFPAEAAERDPPPSTVTEAEKSQMEALLRTNISSFSPGGEELFIIVGLDMGTSTTKIIVRLPFEAGEPAIAVPVPSFCRSGNASYLWRTFLWLQKDGSFCAWPTNGATVLTSLKQGLIRAHDMAIDQSCNAVAYLALVIRYVRGWLLDNRMGMFRGRKPVWFVNLGMPAASCDDARLVQPYRCIGAAALRLAMSDEAVTVETTRRHVSDPRAAEAGISESAAEEQGIAVIPETAAEVTGFSKSTRSASGLYLLVDVGALTLDACMFRLNQDSREGDRYAFLQADVRPLGVESYFWFQNEGKTNPEFRRQCERALRSVVWNTKLVRDPYAMEWQSGNDVPVFLAGGGAANSLHREIVVSLGPWLQQHTRNAGIRPIELPVPRAIDFPEPIEDFHRMAVALGLSYPTTDIGGFDFPGDIEDVPPPDILDISNRFVSKDQV